MTRRRPPIYALSALLFALLMGHHLAGMASAGEPCPAAGDGLAVHEDGPETATPAPSVQDHVDMAPPPTNAPPTPFLLLNELLPDPEGDDAAGEFIELRNDSTSDAALEGWTLKDHRGRTSALHGTVAAGAAYAFLHAESGIPLPNTGGSIQLLRPDGSIADVVSYAEPVRTGRSYARSASGGWRWTSAPTPGAENAFPDEAVAEAADAAPETTAAATASVPVTERITAAPTAVPAAPPALRLSELMPDPVGAEAEGEWIELVNIGHDVVSLEGWTLDDGDEGGVRVRLAATDVAPGGFAVIGARVAGVTLSNAGETLRLVAPDGAIADTVAYGRAEEGRSYASFPSGWTWTDRPTPGAANMTDDERTAADEASDQHPDDQAGTAVTPTTSDVTAPVPDAEDAPEGFVGTVTLPPGRTSKTIMAVQDEERSMFVRIYGKVPALSAGDVIAIGGGSFRRTDDTRASVHSRDIEIVAHGAVEHHDTEVGELSPEIEGRAVTVGGTIAARGKAWASLSDDAGQNEVRIALPRDHEPPAVGTAVRVRGVLRYRAGASEIVVPRPADLEVLADAPLALETVSPRPDDEPAETHRPARQPMVLAAHDERRSGASVVLWSLPLAAATTLLVWRRRKQAAETG